MDHFLLFMFRVCHAFLSVHCSLVVTCWERANLLALLYVMLSCVFVTFPCGVLDQVWSLIVSIPGICLLTNFVYLFSNDSSWWCYVLICGLLLWPSQVIHALMSHPCAFFISKCQLDISKCLLLFFSFS